MIKIFQLYGYLVLNALDIIFLVRIVYGIGEGSRSKSRVSRLFGKAPDSKCFSLWFVRSVLEILNFAISTKATTDNLETMGVAVFQQTIYKNT